MIIAPALPQKKSFKIKLPPHMILILIYAFCMLFGAVLLYMPFASAGP